MTFHDGSIEAGPSPTVTALLVAAPGFVPRYLALVSAADGDPGDPAVFTELAAYLAELVAERRRREPEVEACLAAVEAATEAATEAGDGAELVAWAFLDSLAPDERDALTPWFGARTRALAAELDVAPDHA